MATVTFTQSCSNCKYVGRSDHWHKMGLNSGPACHYNAPIIGENGSAEWPLVKTDYWCGEWAAQPAIVDTRPEGRDTQ